METTICKIGDSVGVIFPRALQAEVGKKYMIYLPLPLIGKDSEML